ncbi:nitronate monooxygenase [Bradyrhizobium sp. USDA 3256]
MSADPLAHFRGRLRLPLIAAPMFLVSGVELVVAACRNGVIGSFPTVNCRETEQLDAWLGDIARRLQAHADASGQAAAPICPNLIVHRSNTRLAQDLAVLLRHKPELVITSVGSPAPVLGPLHDAGALVFADVASIRHAERAVAAGADGLVLLTAGAGGQTGWLNPFVFVRAVRGFFDGPIVLAGGIGDGHALRAAEALGCDLAYMGTKFIATRESMADGRYKQMLVDSTADDIMLTTAFTAPADQHAAALDRGRRSRSRRPAGTRRDRHRQGHRHRRPRKPPQTLARYLERRSFHLRGDRGARRRRTRGADDRGV